MRTVYTTTLTVREQTDATAALDMVGTWIQNWYRRLRITIDWPTASTADFEITPKPHHRLSVKGRTLKNRPESVLLDLLWEYPDDYDQTLGWTVRLSAVYESIGLVMSLELAVRGRTFQIFPAGYQFGAPRLIRNVSRLRSTHIGGHPYHLAAELITAEDVDVLTSLLLNPTRPFPIVVVSRRLESDRPLVDANLLAENLAGIAKVFELSDRWAAYRLTEEIGKTLSCYAGAVRLYWPRFKKDDDQFHHRSWMPWMLKDEASINALFKEIVETVAEAAAFRHVEPFQVVDFVSWLTLRIVKNGEVLPETMPTRYSKN
ncbi:hypothetical protein VAPA_1c47430 [Variovorax paradoxus B4]|uniref:Uncharacterized protein n=1 Tax=Variovorax paradoxus B4 TaxID=1246301 RepID=T1XHI7_VARPD|nr:hypothetical protein [Variovorax paradoxus]AGU51809.1 hypothetical protein VAPA_1c47430 [Variovorax paradoxus B4]